MHFLLSLASDAICLWETMVEWSRYPIPSQRARLSSKKQVGKPVSLWLPGESSQRRLFSGGRSRVCRDTSSPEDKPLSWVCYRQCLHISIYHASKRKSRCSYFWNSVFCKNFCSKRLFLLKKAHEEKNRFLRLPRLVESQFQ